MERLARSARLWRWHWRSFSSFQTLTSRSSPLSTYAKFASSWFASSDVSRSRVLREDYSLLPVFLAGVFGSGLVGVAYADNGAVDVQERAKNERQRIEELMRSRGIRYGSYPSFSVAVKGQKVSIKFQIPHGCEISQLIANLTANLGTKAEGHGGGSDMLLRAWNGPVAWQLTLTHPSEQKHIPGNDMSSKDISADDTDLCILIFHSLVGLDKAEIEFIKQGELSPEELDAFISVLQLAGNMLGQKNTLERKPKEETGKLPSVDKSISELEGMGVRIYGLDEPVGISKDGEREISWDNIAGYEHQKRLIEDTILLALHSPEVYDDIARGTRHKFESNRPRAVLFEGPPVVRLMGRAASHITLECALQTHPNITIIGEEVAAKKLTLKNVTDYIVDVVCKRAEISYNYGVILIPEGLIDFIPEVQHLIGELNEILAHDIVDEGGLWKKKLSDQSLKLFDFLPQAIQEQLMLERDPHGNVQVAKIETEKMLIQMVETELEKRREEGKYKGQFRGQSHFFGYEGRCGLPTNFDATYCYALGYGAGALLHSGKTGLISSVGNLSAPVEEWTVGGTALTLLMDVERRHGKFKPVIKKAMVELEGAPFKMFASLRDEWALKNCYVSPGPIQFSGPGSDATNHTLLLELESQA